MCAHLSFQLALVFTLKVVSGRYGGVETSGGMISFPMRHLAGDFITERNLQSETGLPQVSQVAGLFQGIGTHYVDLWCGTPEKQRQTVIIATGSPKVGFPCKGCQDCGQLLFHTDTYFNGDDSSTFEKTSCGECTLGGTCAESSSSCRVSAGYQEGSNWDGYEAEDSCYIGGLHDAVVPKDDPSLDPLDPAHAADFAFRLRFGCMQHVTELFKEQLADGIVGMSNSKTSLWSQMYEAGKIRQPAFSVCMRRRNQHLRKGSEAGALSLGGSDARLHKIPMVYSAYEPEEGNTSLFTVRINNIYLRAGGGGESVVSTDKNLEVRSIGVSEQVLNRGGIYVDTGTTDTFLWSGLQEKFEATFREISGKDYNNSPIEMTEEELAMRPTILLQLAGNTTRNSRLSDTHPDVKGLAGELDSSRPLDILVAIPPENYYEFVESTGPGTAKYVARIYFDDSRDDIIGANSLIGHDVLFQGGEAGLGWAESDCNYTELIESRKKASTPAGKDSVTSPSEKQCAGSCGFGVFLLVSCAVGLLAFLFVRYRKAKNASLSNELELRAVDNDAQFT